MLNTVIQTKTSYIVNVVVCLRRFVSTSKIIFKISTLKSVPSYITCCNYAFQFSFFTKNLSCFLESVNHYKRRRVLRFVSFDSYSRSALILLFDFLKLKDFFNVYINLTCMRKLLPQQMLMLKNYLKLRKVLS